MTAYFGALYHGVYQLDLEEKKGPAADPSVVNFSVDATCIVCQKTVPKPLRCAACKAVVYCSKECSAQDWKYGPVLGVAKPLLHKTNCPNNKRHMARVADVQALLLKFPWGRIETDDTFCVDFARARFKVLGAKGFGYWSQPGGTAPHLLGRQTAFDLARNEAHQTAANSDPETAAMLKLMKPAKDYFHGYPLHNDKHFTDLSGWKLDLDLTPRLSFDKESMPMIATSFPGGIIDWESWYKWRKLPLQSPAALLMHYPMSLYQLLTRVLRVIDPAEASNGSRRRLLLHYLGAEVELNFLPLFAELALLLPYTDISMHVFGVAVYDVVKGAPRGSIAARTMTPAYTYKAPKALGDSKINIYLAGTTQDWMAGEPYALAGGRAPDALLAPNAGLASYPAWFNVIAWAHLYNVPFGVTEYAEQSAEVQRGNLPIINSMIIEQQAARLSKDMREQGLKPREYPIAWNPFQRPGQRELPNIRLPSLINGFTMAVIRREDGKEVDSISAQLEGSSLEGAK